MAIIPLRVYNHEIEGLIDNKQLDEAVAHCRHILATFPKYIATYRLLGKAHLEQQRISDATDVFQRVLSAIPDDFTANVGMSIIREDENNLDASIWHMELAYEAQPSNVAIQDELRRLYGRRDGTQPPKVRLTRGALARMYAKGGLFDQAIAELRAAIAEDPNRPDLQLLLAQLLFQISQRVDAVEMCVNILKKIPYCLSANQILAVCLPEVEGSNTRKNYRQTAITMDPYFAFADLESINADQVPDNAVNIEKLEWKPGVEMSEATEQPNWATSLGISMEKTAEEQLPDWLQGAEASSPVQSEGQAEEAVSPFFWDTQEVKNIINEDQKPEEEIPDWMKDAGWKPTTGEADSEIPPVEETRSEDIKEEELAKADLPDWLRGLAPEGILEEESPATQPEEKDVSLPWLEKQQPGPTDSIIQWLEEKQPETPVAKAEAAEPISENPEEIPEWLKDLDTPLGVSAPEQSEDQIVPAPALVETPAFIEEIPEETILPNLSQAPIPDESQEPVSPMEQSAEPVGSASEAADTQAQESPVSAVEELPDWIKELAGILPPSVPIETEKESKGQPAATEEETVVKSSAFIEEIPLMNPPVEAQERVDQPQETTPNRSDTEPSRSDTEILSWMEEQPTETPAQDNLQVSPLLEQPNAVPGWQNRETVKEELSFPTEPETGEPSKLPIEEIPDWIKGLGETPVEEIPSELVPETPVEQEIPTESVSATPFEQEIPSELVPETPTEQEIPSEPVTETPAEAQPQPAEELPSWLLEFEQPAEEEPSQPIPEALEWKEGELPDWIKEITEAPPAEEAVKAPETEEIPPVPAIPQTEWVAEDVIPPAPEVVAAEETALPSPEVESVVPSEAQQEEQVWMAEGGAAEQPMTAPTPEPEAAPITVSEEITAEEIEDSSVITAEEPAAPALTAAEVDLSTLEGARNAITQGLPAQAAELYASLVHRSLHLDEVLKDLQDAVYRYPVDVNLWVTLGDTYFQKDDLQQALNNYSKAEELVR